MLIYNKRKRPFWQIKSILAWMALTLYKGQENTSLFFRFIYRTANPFHTPIKKKFLFVKCRFINKCNEGQKYKSHFIQLIDFLP